MYCLYKNSNVVWQGTRPNAALNEKLDLTLSKDAFRRATPEELATLDIYRLQEAPKTVGKIITVTNHLRDGHVVSELFTEEDDPNYIAPEPVDLVQMQRDNLVAQIKRVAGEMILEILPEWKQRNMALAETVDWTDAEVAAYGELLRLRAKSDELEAAVADMTVEEMNDFDVNNGEVWADVHLSE